MRMLGKTPVALLITLIVCLAVFAKDYGMAKLEKLCGESLAPICGVILVTGAGGMFGGVLRSSGIGDALADVLTDTGMPVIVALTNTNWHTLTCFTTYANALVDT